MSAQFNDSNDQRKIFQVHCGRWEQANVIDHPGRVIAHLISYDWKSLKQALGITHVYLLGIWENSGDIVVNEENGVDLRSHPQRYPSPFAITNHVVVNPDLGTAVDMSNLIACLHGENIKVIVDFVPNHTGLGHDWIRDHRDYYKINSNGSIQTAFSGDVAELNYNNQNLRNEMKRILSYIAEFGFDGVRCDMAHLIPISFWNEAITDIKMRFNDFSWLAEAYSNSVFDLDIQNKLIEAGFDAIYDEPLYRNLAESSDADRVSMFLGHYSYVLNNKATKWIHYLSNHDNGFPLPYEQFSLWFRLISLLPGWLFIYNGSLWGRSSRIAHHWIEILPEIQTLSDTLKDEYVYWFRWLNSEHPKIFQIESDDMIKISWKGDNNQGTVWFNVSGLSKNIKISTSEIAIYPDMYENILANYQVLITQKL